MISIEESMAHNLKAFIDQSDEGKDLGFSPYINYYKGLNLKTSFGQGTPARITWISFRGQGQKTSKGIYISFLYFKPNKTVVIAYGISEEDTPDIEWIVPDGTPTIQKYFKENGLGKPNRYGDSFVYKAYSTNNLDYNNLVKDIDNLIVEYQEILSLNNISKVAVFEAPDPQKKGQKRDFFDETSIDSKKKGEKPKEPKAAQVELDTERNNKLFDELITEFKKIHPVKPFAGCDELHKWQLITMCQGMSNIDIAKAIAENQKELLADYDVSSLNKNILSTEEGQNNFNRILDILYDESRSIEDRLLEFKKTQNDIWPKASNLPDDNRSASVFLACKYPDQYTFSAWNGVYRKLCKYLGETEKKDSTFLPHFLAMLNPLKEKVSQDEELKQMIKDSTPDCIQSDLLTAQTIVYTMLCGGSSNEGTESGIPEKKIENDNNPQKPAAPIIGTNVIFYGAPGTGKSYHIDHDVIRACKSYKRTTFHPDTDYSAFVGCYKPTRDKATEKITYKFVSQVFVKAYVQAWLNRAKEMYLIIEEINRGNCAQIFGDIFQLLDRNEEGWSSYDIEPDCDLQDCLAEEFSKNGNKIDTRNLPSRVIDIISKIESGEKMLLPNNLFLWATMNTSDQSLFPIDSAFKRRWDWKYRPIAKGKDQETGKDITRTISVGSGYDWWEFLQEINTAIFDVTNSEDKQLGFWFVKPDTEGNRISCNLFVEKVLFYLWSDVFKDYSEGSPFKFGNATHPFVHFINEDETVKEDLAEKFLKNLFKEKDSVQGIPEEGESTEPINA